MKTPLQPTEKDRTAIQMALHEDFAAKNAARILINALPLFRGSVAVTSREETPKQKPYWAWG